MSESATLIGITWKTVAIHIGSLSILVAGGIWYAAHKDEVLADHERRILEIKIVNDEQTKVFRDQSIQLARIEEQIKFLNQNLERAAVVKK